eukprot:scaffold2799_cov408-Prasinococcus_capsulatus_cf.AAC.22
MEAMHVGSPSSAAPAPARPARPWRTGAACPAPAAAHDADSFGGGGARPDAMRCDARASGWGGRAAMRSRAALIRRRAPLRAPPRPSGALRGRPPRPRGGRPRTLAQPFRAPRLYRSGPGSGPGRAATTASPGGRASAGGEWVSINGPAFPVERTSGEWARVSLSSSSLPVLASSLLPVAAQRGLHAPLAGRGTQ